MIALSLGIELAMIVVAAVVASSLTGNVPLPTHWDIRGQPNSFADKWTALLIPALIAGSASLVLYVLPSIEPRISHLQRSQGLYLWTWMSLLFVSIAVQLAIISAALRWRIHGTSFVLGGMGTMLALMGNQFGKSRSMYLIGIRTPWTLASEEVWMKTHRLSGKLFVAGGLLVLAEAFMPVPIGISVTLFMAVIMVAVLYPIVYSYLLWRRDPAGGRVVR